MSALLGTENMMPNTTDELKRLLAPESGISYACNPIVNSGYFTLSDVGDVSDLDLLGRTLIRTFPGALQVSLNIDNRQLEVVADSKEIFDQLQALAKRGYN